MSWAHEGDLLGERFFLERAFAEGGTSTLYDAHDLETGEAVVVKVPRFESPRGTVAKRLEREGRALAVAGATTDRAVTVRHVGHGLRGGRAFPYLVLEKLEGVDLSTLVRERGALAVGEACRLMHEAARALAAAHRAGLVHRDVKPANLFLQQTSRDVHVRLIDFGIAKQTDETELEPATALTRAGDLLGSLAFMPPEQITHAADVDARADVWALGATLFFLLTGRTPFSREQAGDVLGAILYEEHEPLEQVRPDVPSGLARLVDACLSKRPALRPDADAFAAELAPFVTLLPGERVAMRRLPAVRRALRLAIGRAVHRSVTHFWRTWAALVESTRRAARTLRHVPPRPSRLAP